MSATTDAIRPLRRDAVLNRTRLLAAARVAFAEEGLEVGVDAIAHRAGVGTGTLYRRFPTKEHLIQALFEERIAELEPVAARALARDDAWEGLRELLHAAIALQAADQGFLQTVARRLGPEILTPDARERFYAPMRELLRRAQRAGQVRADVKPEDLPVIVRMAAGAVLPVPTGPDPAEAWPRLLGVLLDGLRA